MRVAYRLATPPLCGAWLLPITAIFYRGSFDFPFDLAARGLAIPASVITLHLQDPVEGTFTDSNVRRRFNVTTQRSSFYEGVWPGSLGRRRPRAPNARDHQQFNVLSPKSVVTSSPHLNEMKAWADVVGDSSM
jgi:hypothetical protein